MGGVYLKSHWAEAKMPLVEVLRSSTSRYVLITGKRFEIGDTNGFNLMKRLLVLGILILFSNESLASLSDFLYIGNVTQTVGTVTSIIDGDTIKVNLPDTKITVRLLSINTPEMPDEPFAQEAKTFTSQKLLNQPIKLFYSTNPEQQKDKYNRLLAVVIKNDEIFNIKLLEQGLAVRMFIFNDIIKFPAWEDVEIKARQQRLNIWSNINSNGIFINEINPNPFPESDYEAEFVELYNHTSTAVDVGSWTLICIYNKVVIPAGTIIPAYGYLIIAKTNTTGFKQIYHNTPQEAIIIDDGTNLILRNSYNPKEDLVLCLKAQDNSYQDSLAYNLDWDSGNANGTGRTLERKSCSVINVGDSKVGGVDDANWEPSINLKGTPGRSNSVAISHLDVPSWIISCQRDTGAICTNQSQTKIIPYKANIAALGLLEKGGYEDAVKAWIKWYFAHLEGWIIYDYEVANNTEVSLGSAEAEDRNLGTFFTLLKKYYQATLDVDFLKNYQTQMKDMGFYMLFALQDSNDNLTWTDSYREQKLLINNTQSYQGLKDLASLYFDLFDDVNQRDLYYVGAELIREAIDTELWNENQKWYYWKKDNLENKTDCNWAILYPDAISQLYTINVQLPESYRSFTLYDTFNTNQSNWYGTASYCEMGYLTSLMADVTRTQSYQDSITNNVINQGYSSPWDCKDAGFYLLMENRLAELATIQPLLNNSKELCVNFINSQMLTPYGGIQAQFMNIAPISQTDGVNHEVTSEATSQALLYAALSKNKTFFDEQFEILKNNLCSEHNILVWKLTPNGDWWKNKYGGYANASIDDLRAISGLLLAYDVWGNVDYLSQATLLAQGLKGHNIEDHELRDYSSWNGWKSISQDVLLSYIDLATMKRLAEFDIDWENILQTNKQIILGGTASSGLYYHKYDSTTHNYFPMENNNIHMIHSAWTAENLAQYWKLTGDQNCKASAEKFLNFVKNEYHTYGKIFGKYDIDQGTHTVEYEDITVYSIIARLAFILGDFEFAKTLRDNKILPYQNTNEKSQTVGCFGYDFKKPYAFVCLEALLAIVELEAKEEYFIRGTVSTDNKQLEGVLLTLSGTTFATTTTNSKGEYKLYGAPNGSYTITPYKQGYKFIPQSKQISHLNSHLDNVDFEAGYGKITSVSPVSGTTGTLIIITGEGFMEEEIRISFGEVTTVKVVTSNPSGKFSATFTASIQPSGTITISAYGGSSTVIGINYFFLQALHHFTIGTISPQTAGEGFEISIYAVDARNDIFGYCGTASLTDDSMSIFETIYFAEGIWTGTITISKAGTTTIKVEAEGKIGISAPFSVKATQINKLVLITPPQTVIAGTSTNLIIFQTQDKFGNPANTQNEVEIKLLSSSTKAKFSLAQSPWIDTNTITLTSDTNTGWFYYLDTLAGTHNIILSLDGIIGTQEAIVNPAPLESFNFSTITTQQAGKEFKIEIMAIDAFDNRVVFTGTISLTVNPYVATFTAGISVGSVTITKSGTEAIVAKFDNKCGTSNAFWVNPAQLHRFTIGTITEQIAGKEFTIKVTALDVYENMATYSGTAYLESGFQIILTQGLWEGSITRYKAGTTTIIVFVGENRGTSNPFWISPDVLDHFVFGTISSQEAGIGFAIKIMAMDVYKNIADYSGIAYLQDILPTKTSTFINGIWQGTVSITKSGTTAIIVSIDNKRGTSNNFWLKSGPLHHFSFATITDQIAGKEFGISVVAKDIYENIADYSGKAILQDTSNTLIDIDLKEGIGFGTVTIIQAGTTTIFATTNQGTSNPFYINPDILQKVIITPSEIELSIGSSCPFIASGFDKYSNTIILDGGTWNLIGDIGSLSSYSGVQTTFYAGMENASGWIRYEIYGIVAMATITVSAAELHHILIYPQNPEIKIKEEISFMAKGFDIYDNETHIEGGNWELESGLGGIDTLIGTQTKFYAGTKATSGMIKYTMNQKTGFATITILPGTHTYFKIGTISSPQTAGKPFFISITPYDFYGNIIKDYVGVVKLSDSTGKIYPKEFKSGILTGTVTIEKVSDNIIITAQDSETPAIKGTSNPFTIYSNVLARFNISRIEPTQIINSKIPIVITAEDVYGNIITNYNGTFSLTDDTQTIYPRAGAFTSGKFSGTVSISKAKPKIKITVTSADKIGISDDFTTLIDNQSDGKVTGDDKKIFVEIPKNALLTDFYIDIDPTPEAQRLNINLANSALSQDPTSRGITNSLHLFQAYDKDDKPIQIGTGSLILISLPYSDDNQDGIVDSSDVPIKEETLKMYELKNSHWIEVKNCTVHRYKNIVSASVPCFGVYMLIGQIVPENLDIVKVYPIPFKPIRWDSEIIFDGLPQNTTIRIYDISGSLIKEIENITIGTYGWDVKDAYGKDVASGIYIYIVTCDWMKKIGKIAIIR